MIFNTVIEEKVEGRQVKDSMMYYQHALLVVWYVLDGDGRR